ncbi:P-loop containing nucleoside triphosphate hydrolase protein [Leucogyrophana mollusca]|uniref:P-loop containing nucleoside triphosphate hydrolase protein n=1 Tax=Leucogyrophana mollusca TaxID=85980 RepID=A0ACB8BB94_9AGAM|nr:P-loop containing nucleoside triphosphate hydrolase protein [Leucogyrophana mollusca]
MEDRFFQIDSIDTTKLTETVLSFLAKSASESYQRDQMKPTEVVHRLNSGASWDSAKMQVRAKADRYQNRMRRGSNQYARIAVGGASGFSVLGEVDEVHGQAADLATTGNLEGKVVKGITIIGRDDPTAAEARRDLAILHALQGKLKLEGENPWVQRIWLMSADFAWPQVWSAECPAPAVKFNPSRLARPLNPSQITAVEDMLQQTGDSRITIIQGPPGTGKTTVIASYVQTALLGGRSGIWLLAQSNVAVKNIAEKLVAFGIYNWKLLVSQDFFEYWHEHLYTDIRSNIILSKDFPLPGLLRKELSGCPVVLCTLSMLSNHMLQLQGVFRAVPLKTVIVDEASQIEIGDYIPLFTAHTSIRKVCFIGDDKQLPPYGQDNIEELQSIFEVQHLRDQTILLNTQYRMPPQIGDFISQAIYDSKLESNPLHPITTDIMACHFVNISPGAEEASGTSYKNTGECHAILKIAAHLEEHHKNYRIITPYEGNEDDYIIISLVRSGGLGFLSDLRRTNVMLTRCKRGMFICTSKAFMERAGKDSLVGSLLEYYDNEAWMEVSELETIQL